MVGGLETFGSARVCVSRSCTIWRAFIRSVPGAKIISIVESPAIDSDWMTCSHGTPLSRSASSGTVINDSTSALERPSDSVFTVSEGSANSGMTSSGLFLTSTAPRISRPEAATTIRVRKRTLKDMSHANISPPSTHKVRVSGRNRTPLVRYRWIWDSGCYLARAHNASGFRANPNLFHQFTATSQRQFGPFIATLYNNFVTGVRNRVHRLLYFFLHLDRNKTQ